MIFVILSLAFLSGVLLVLGLTAASTKNEIEIRLEQIMLARAAPVAPAEPQVQPRTYPLRRFLNSLASHYTPTPQAGLLIERAGDPANLDASQFFGLRILIASIFLLLIFIACSLLHSSLLIKAGISFFFMVIGLAIPDAWLQGEIKARQRQIQRSLPDILDLLVVSMEAGAGFDSAVSQVAHSLQGPLPNELRRAQLEMTLGLARAESLKNMALRIDLPDISTFVSAIVQADRLGSGVSQALRTQSQTARVRRIQHVREAAAKLPTQMLFPLVFFLLPALFVTIIGPGLVNLLRILQK
jgi:tight adherence protein C